MLTAWIDSIKHRTREPGVFDCCTMPADWAMTLGHGDPMAKWRGAYSTEETALAIVEAAGSLERLFDEGFAAIGIELREGPAMAGDVGVILIAGHEAGAVFTGKRWLFVAQRGIGMASIDPGMICATWAVCHG